MQNRVGYSSMLAYINWSVRIVTILFAAFLSIFSADAYNNEYPSWKNIMFLFIHLIPVMVILIVLAISWKRPLAGVISYALLGSLYIFWAWGRFPLSVYFMIAGPLFVMSVLYFLVWKGQKK